MCAGSDTSSRRRCEYGGRRLPGGRGGLSGHRARRPAGASSPAGADGPRGARAAWPGDRTGACLWADTARPGGCAPRRRARRSARAAARRARRPRGRPAGAAGCRRSVVARGAGPVRRRGARAMAGRAPTLLAGLAGPGRPPPCRAAVAAGGYLTAGHLQGPGGDGPRGMALRRGERAVEVAVTGGGALAGAAPGARVDAIVSTEQGEGEGRTFVALEDVELLGVRAGGEAAAPAGEMEGAAR